MAALAAGSWGSITSHKSYCKGSKIARTFCVVENDSVIIVSLPGPNSISSDIAVTSDCVK